MKRIIVTLGILALCCAAFLALLGPGRNTIKAQGNSTGKPEGKIAKSYRKEQPGEKPVWVADAHGRSIAHLKRQGIAFGLRNAATELSLFGANEDDLGQTHVRLDQVYNGVPVFGGQLVSHLDASSVREVGGRIYKEARFVNTTPKLSPAQAIEAAKAALGYTGEFARQPDAQLVVLPHQVKDPGSEPGATLCYQVELLIEDGTTATARHEYFVNAKDGRIVWHYNNMDSGVGYSLYSGTVYIDTFRISSSTFQMQAFNRSSMSTFDTLNRTYGGNIFQDSDNYWGNGTTGNRQSAGVDAHFGEMKSWDYYYNVHGRFGIDNNGYRMNSRVHYGVNYNNAFWDGSTLTYGDGDGYNFSPLVPIDVVGHETTHGVTQFTANLTYSNESGAANEAFSDIFGTAIEFYVGINPDYLIGEDCYTPYSPGDAFRSMANPPAFGQPDHYSNRYLGPDDNGGVHTNSGIQNNAFYLLAEGGTNSTSGVTVTGIGRGAAESIFYRALTLKLFPSASFMDVRNATLSAASDLYGAGSAPYNSTARAWYAVGVGPDVPTGGGTDGATFVSHSVPTSMTAGQSYNVSVTMNNSGSTTWTSDVYKLGTQNPQDNTLWIGGNRVYLPAGVTVPPGSNYTFNFTVTAPSTPGYYNFQWQMVHEFVQWFGDFTPNVVVNVTGTGGGCSPTAEESCYSQGGDWYPDTCRCVIPRGCFSGLLPIPCLTPSTR